MKAPLIFYSNKERYTARIPTSWDDVTAREYFNFLRWATSEKKDPIELYSILTGLDYDIIYRAEEYSVRQTIDKLTSFITEDATVHKAKLPEFLHIRDQHVKIPDSLSSKPLGVILGLESEFEQIAKIEDEYEKQLKSLCTSVAYVLCEAITGKPHDSELADELIPEIEKQPITIVMPLALFFWKSMGRSRKGGLIGLVTKLKRKLIGGLVKRLHGLATSGLSTLWRKGMLQNTKA